MKKEESKTLQEKRESVESSPIIDMATTQPDAKGKRFASFVRDYHVCKAFLELAFRTGKVELLRDVKTMLIDGTTLRLGSSAGADLDVDSLNEEEATND